MKKSNQKVKIGESKICINCNYFFPYPLNVASEFGICLNDKMFEPYIEELLENENYDSCKELIIKKKFNGNENCCKDFEMIEIIGEIPENEIVEIDINDEQVLSKIIDITLKNKSIEEYQEKLKSQNRDIQLKAYENIAGLALYGNTKASKILIKSFTEIPPPITLVEAHFKLNVFRLVYRVDNIDEIIPILIRDLYETKSNNQTRQWISEIFRILSIYKQKGKVIEQLTKMLYEKQFSYRIKNKIKNILTKNDYFFY